MYDIDTSTDTVAGSIEVGTMPHGLAITPDGRLVLAAVFGTSQVAFIDTASQQAEDRRAAGRDERRSDRGGQPGGEHRHD